MVQKLNFIDVSWKSSILRYHPAETLDKSTVPADKQQIVATVVDCIRRYRTALQQLISEKYNELIELLPAHLTKQNLVFVTCCPDGTLIRYDKRDIDAVVGAWSDQSAKELVSILSDNYVYLSPESVDPNTSGVSLTLSKTGPGSPPEDLVKGKILVTVDLSASIGQISAGRPQRLVDSTDVIEIHVHGVEFDSNASPDQGRDFIARTPFHLGVGWNGFEVYKFAEARDWNPDLAASWAEQDILLLVARRNIAQEPFRRLDPHFEARQRFVELLDEFDTTLQESAIEESLQRFFSKHPVFIEPTYKKVWRKLPFGPRVTDFVFQRATGDYVLVELEHASKPLFTKQGVQSHFLTQAVDQVLDWRRYLLEDNLHTVQQELGLLDIVPNPKSLVVIGRSKTLDAQARRKLATLEGQCPNLKILTYDDLREQTVRLLRIWLGQSVRPVRLRCIGPCVPRTKRSPHGCATNLWVKLTGPQRDSPRIPPIAHSDPGSAGQ